MTQTTYVNVHGQAINIGALPQAPKRRTAGPVAKATGIEHEDFISLGFVVEGLTHAMLANARDARQREIDGYEDACATARDEHRAAPKKPVPFDEGVWLRTAKRAKVRAKPYEIRAAADECAALAAKQGWLVVSVAEVRRERKS